MDISCEMIKDGIIVPENFVHKPIELKATKPLYLESLKIKIGMFAKKSNLRSAGWFHVECP
jgi:hypothetical protein